MCLLSVCLEDPLTVSVIDYSCNNVIIVKQLSRV